ncbi:radical SAM family heme chaperone HemW [Urechidicola vernalis]|uniref:Heme chaperone HemW n=1 Tax=Urechidicola vernalis TaxID=3075600 RepID=A0ABU2Y5Q6_9FLAO|nr:radical SAM family heme chaperone HemW [Urechidicola sp. P050]MDT0553539.1 radical SAM family heme chaperone HemW [Urechidicola sp. P050]
MAGIYLHIPFCKQACFYCDFHFSTSVKRKSEMVDAICKEIALRKREIDDVIETIYFGGGTPSLLSEQELEQILNTIWANFEVNESPEITLEANPDDLTEERIIQLSNSPINRLSIGIQSFFEEELKSMNRVHTATESLNCLSVATGYFENITVDLIYGIPNMSSEKWKQNLQKVFDLGISHISSYALTVESKTALESFIKKGIYPPLDEQLASEHFNILVEETANNGFVHYETSNFGKDGFFSKHNTSYWKGVSYLGIGPSAHSFIGNTRSWNVANNAKYINAIEQGELPSENEVLSEKDQFNEYIMTGLRTIWGVDLQKIKMDFGNAYFDYLKTTSEKFITQGLLEISNCHSEPVEESLNSNVLRTTQKGKFLVDGIASDLFMI